MDLEAGALSIRELLAVTGTWGNIPFTGLRGPASGTKQPYSLDGHFVPEPGREGLIAPPDAIVPDDGFTRGSVAHALGLPRARVPAGRWLDRAHVYLGRLLAATIEAMWQAVPDDAEGPTHEAVVNLRARLRWSAAVHVGFPGLYQDAESLDNDGEHLIRPGFCTVCRGIPPQGQFLLSVWATARGVPADYVQVITTFIDEGDPLAFPVYLAHMQGVGLGGVRMLNHSVSWDRRWENIFDRPLPRPLARRPSGYWHPVVSEPPRGRQRAGSRYGSRFPHSESEEELLGSDVDFADDL